MLSSQYLHFALQFILIRFTLENTYHTYYLRSIFTLSNQGAIVICYCNHTYFLYVSELLYIEEYDSYAFINVSYELISYTYHGIDIHNCIVMLKDLRCVRGGLTILLL